MNLIELILWIFSAIVAGAAAVYGYRFFGIFGAVAGIVFGLVGGFVIGTSVMKVLNLALFSKQSGKSRNKHDNAHK